MLLIGSLLPMMSAQTIGVRSAQAMVVACLVVGGIWVAWYGRESLLDAAEIMKRPLAWYEWLLDLNLTEPRPFHSFMFIQMPWWALAHGAFAIAMAWKIAFPSTTP